MSTLIQVMACCLTAPSHYLNQCWHFIGKVQWHSSECNFTRDTSAISHWNLIENYLSKILFKSPRGQWVNSVKNPFSGNAITDYRNITDFGHARQLRHVGPRWAPCLPHEPCYLGKLCANQSNPYMTRVDWLFSMVIKLASYRKSAFKYWSFEIQNIGLWRHAFVSSHIRTEQCIIINPYISWVPKCIPKIRLL